MRVVVADVGFHEMLKPAANLYAGLSTHVGNSNSRLASWLTQHCGSRFLRAVLQELLIHPQLQH